MIENRNTKNLIIKEFPINNKIFAYYLIIILCLYFFFIQKYCIDNYLSNYAISDLLIHYNGEFLRRGLIGTFLLKISLFFGVSLKFVVQYFFYLVYALYFLIYYLFLKKLNYKNKFLVLFVILSPLGILYPLYELESLLRKEIFLYIFFILFLIILEKNFSEKIYYLYLSIILPILILIHEGFIFFISIFFLSWSIQKLKINSYLQLKDIIISSLTTIIVALLHIKFIFHSIGDGYVDQMVQNLSNYDYAVNKFGAFVYLEKELSFSLKVIYNNLTANHFAKFIILFILSFFPLIYFFKIMHVIKKEIKLFLIMTLISFSIIFFVAFDWGRFISVIFNLLIFLFIFSINIYDKFLNFRVKNHLVIMFFLIIYCSTWNPKTTFHERINLLPPKDVIERIILYK